MKNFRHFFWISLGALVILNVFVWTNAIRFEGSRGMLTVSFLNVGQGDAILIESPTGVQAMIDGGPDASTLRALSHELPFFDRTVDILLVSNPDKDHMAGFIDVLKTYRVGSIIEPGTKPTTDVYEAFQKAVEAEGARHIVVRRGDIIDLGGGAVLEILFPDRDASEMKTNDGSIVARLRFGDTAFFFSGDAPQSVERYAVWLDGSTLKSNVLKVGHHGSRTSTSPELLAAVAPALAVISAGEKNRYGHPHQEVLDTLNTFNVKTLGTYERGTIVLRSNGTDVRVIRGGKK